MHTFPHKCNSIIEMNTENKAAIFYHRAWGWSYKSGDGAILLTEKAILSACAG